MSDIYRLVLITTVADEKKDFEKLIEACRTLSTYKGNMGQEKYNLSISREIPKQMLSPKEAFDKTMEYVPLSEAKGRICAGLIGAYPPGIPALSGELIDIAGIEELLEIKAWGGQLWRGGKGYGSGCCRITRTKDLEPNKGGVKWES